MASIVERNHKFKVVYYYKNDAGKRIQKWETYDTKAEAVSYTHLTLPTT